MLFLSEIKKRLIKFSIFDLAAQVAYYLLISFFPFLFMVVALLGYLPFSSNDVLHMIQSYLPAVPDKILKSNLESIFDRENTGIFSISLLSTTYLASFGFHSLIRVLDHIYEVDESRTLWKEWIVGILLMFGLLLGFMISLVLSVFGDVISNSFFQLLDITIRAQFIWTISRWWISSMFLIFIFFCLYMFAPNKKVAIKEAVPGAIFATFSWQLSSLLFSYYVDVLDYSYLYGNLGSAIMLLGWFYWSSFVVILGGMINAVLLKIRN